MTVRAIDHVALPIREVEPMLAFYERLGFEIHRLEHDGLRYYVAQLDEHRINFHDPVTWESGTFTLRGPTAVPGCGDLCFAWDGDVDSALAFAADAGVEVEEGPVTRTGGHGAGRVKGRSVYIRDPDRNLVELIVYPT